MEFRQFLANLKRWSWYLVLGTVVAAVSSLLIARRLPPVYEAHATLLVNAVSSPNGPTASDMTLSQQLVKTFIQLADQPVILDQVAQQLGDSVTAQQLARMVSVQPVRDTQLFSIGVTGPDPVLVRDIANTVAAVFIDQQSQWLPLNQPNSSVIVVQPAVVPGQRSGQTPVAVTVALAAVVGLLLSLATALIWDALDDRFKTPDEFERTVGLPVLGAVKRISASSRARPSGVLDPVPRQTPANEVYRLIRTRLDFAAVQRPFRTLLVASAQPGEGRSATVANLAIALAQVGRRVVAVDCDLRQPALHRMFGLADQPGLTDLLLRCGPDDGPDVWTSCLQLGPVPGLLVLTSGPLPLDPTELLQSPRFQEVLTWLAEEADLVLLDSPAVLTVADALALAKSADATLLVAAPARTSADAVRRTVLALRESPSTLVGAILNRPRGRLGPQSRTAQRGSAPARTSPLQQDSSKRVGPTDYDGRTHRTFDLEPGANGHARADQSEAATPGDRRRGAGV